MYSNPNEIPTEVKNSLDEDDCKVWMDAYNELDPKTDEEIAQAKKHAWESCKTLPSSFSFDIIASVEDVDSDGELITIDSLKSQMDDFIKQGGTSQDEHGNYHVATIWDWEDYTDPDTGYPGVLVHGNVFGGRGENTEFAQARQDFIDGKNNLSIAGDASVEGYECDGARCYVKRNLTQLMEISLVENPANPYARLVWYNDKAIVKNGDKTTNLKVQNVGIHKSYAECDLELLRRCLKGYDTKTTRNGVRVQAYGKDRLYKISKAIEGIGQITMITGPNTIMVDTNKRILEKEFKKSFFNQECDVNGTLIPDKIEKSRFMSLHSMRMIKERKDGTWGFDGSILKKKRKPDAKELIQMIEERNRDSPWMAYCEKLTQIVDEVMSEYNLNPDYEEIVRDYLSDAPGISNDYSESTLQDYIDRRVSKSNVGSI